MNETMQSAAAKQNLQTVGTIKKLSLNFVEKWRKIRESTDYAMRFYSRPKLIVR